jgi:ADP-heptose:LPS heptosyltransferase
MSAAAERGMRGLRRLDAVFGIPLVAALAAAGRPRVREELLGTLNPRRVAVLCLGAIGDLLLASALLHALALLYPEASITVYASPANAQALPLLGGRFQSTVFSIRNFPGIIAHLRKSRPQMLVDTTQWARLGALISLCSGVDCTIGFDTPGQFRGRAYAFPVLHHPYRHETENFLALARRINPRVTARPAIQLPEAPPLRPDLADCPMERVIYLHMFASGLYSHLKEWPASRWAELALACVGEGRAVRLTGAESDRRRAEDFLRAHVPDHLRRNGSVRSLAGKVSLTELAWLFSRGAGVVSVNTGILHLAALCDAPVVGLHGPTNPLRWGGVGDKVVSLVAPGADSAYLNLGFEYPAFALPPLSSLPAADVLQALKGLLARTRCGC